MRGRNENAEAAAGTDDTSREFHVVAMLQHGWESEQPHERDNGADDAGGGGEKCASS